MNELQVHALVFVTACLSCLVSGGCAESNQYPTAGEPLACGNGILDPGEECDDGAVNTAWCDDDCTLAVCGDGHVNTASGEACDDGDGNGTDFCTASCQLANCQDGRQNADESDIDCGGACGPTCALLQACDSPDDCGSRVCVAGTCRAGRIAGGGSHTCALLSTGEVRCWGYGYGGQLGYGNTASIGDDETPRSAGAVPVGGRVVQLTAGDAHTCALLDRGAVRCWGWNAYGQLGYGHTRWIGDDEAPSTAGDVDVGGAVVQVVAGEEFTCALLSTGAVRCWGRGDHGQLGRGNTDWIGDDETPSTAGDVDVGGAVMQLATGAAHVCALLADGSVRCWGRGDDGRLGYGDTDPIGDDETPSAAGTVDVGGPVSQIVAGEAHTCALLVSGDVRCWGHGGEGRLGRADADAIGDDESPGEAEIVDVGGPVVQLAAGWRHTCALLAGGAVRCWGRGNEGQLGHGNTDTIGDDETPSAAGDVEVGGEVIYVTAGAAHTCALLASGPLRCWGYGSFGQLGYASTDHIGDDELPASAGDVPYE